MNGGEVIGEVLARNGVQAVFTLCGGNISPILVGGPYSNMIANVVATQFGMAMNWPLGSAIAVVILIIVVGILTLSDRFERVGRLNLG